jgi:uncharacterized protein (DUF58 family)
VRYRIALQPTLPYPGERERKKPGLGGEFYELRGYAPGDDPRRVYWRAYARTGRLYTRVETPLERVQYTVYLDSSPSMDLFGKRAYAEEVARLLLRIARFEDRRARLLRGPPQEAPRKSGLVLVTDGLDPLAWPRLLPRRSALVQVLAPEELDPPKEAALLRDVETGERLRVDAESRAAYLEALAGHLAALSLLARLRGRYALLRVGEAPLKPLLRQGVLELL